MTPILDLEKDPPQPASNRLLWVIGFLLGVAAGFAIFVSSTDAITLFALIPAFYLAVAIHEIGHLIAGRLVGMEYGGLAVGGFSVFRSGERWVFRFNFRNIMCGGLAKTLPPDGEISRAKFAWMVAGGPLGSFLCACMSEAASLIYGNGGLWTSLFWAGIVITVLSVVPISMGINKSDGARLWMLLRQPEQSRSWMALLAIQTQEAHGARPRDWNPKLVTQMLSTTSPSEGDYSYRQWLAFYRSDDEGDERAALEHLENALAGSRRAGPAVRHGLFLEAASASALAHGNAARARIWLARASKIRKPLSIAGVEASIAICEKRYDDAIEHLAVARDFLIRRKLNSGLIRFAMEKLNEYQNECVAARNQAISVDTVQYGTSPA